MKVWSLWQTLTHLNIFEAGKVMGQTAEHVFDTKKQDCTRSHGLVNVWVVVRCEGTRSFAKCRSTPVCKGPR